MPAPAVSVVVPTRGGARRLPVLLEALAGQVLDEPWEVVVVLDGDVDGSRQLIDGVRRPAAAARPRAGQE